MSDALADREIVAQFVISWRASGHFLPYDDYAVIDGWLAQGADPSALIQALSEVLPAHYGTNSRSNHPPPLRLIEKKIARKVTRVMAPS